jgi:hypothetical protein
VSDNILAKLIATIMDGHHDTAPVTRLQFNCPADFSTSRK